MRWNSSRTIQNLKGWCHQGVAFNISVNLEDPAGATGLEKVNPHPQILHARLQHYANQELSDVHAEFRKGRGNRDQIANILWITEKAREFQRDIYFCFTDYTKAFDCVDHTKLWKALKEMGLPDHLTCLLRNLYVGREEIIRTLYGTTNWFKIEKGVRQGCLLSLCLFNLYAEQIMRNARLDELQAGNNIGGRNVNNHRYTDDTTLIPER